ncbi:restriction endonuclease subunit S [Photobacterium damselae subsp. damselae]|uniref:Restriction endonuclease subunit S n=1 Tax=Photobacterium damselae subsp. damselae TaxID=85581 RepID=A0A850R6D9_PHODD|nr:restriction endonuclease subunit S [Photobacterium damselae subsp. damselae]
MEKNPIAFSLPRYDYYKSSGREFLGDIPNDWSVLRLKYAAKINPTLLISKDQMNSNASFLPMEAVSVSGRVNYEIQRPVTELRQGFTSFKKNDVILAKITPCFENGKGALLDNMPTEIGFGSTEFHVIRAQYGFDPKFLYYLTKTNLFKQLGEQLMTGSAGQKRVQTSFVSNYYFPRPAYQTQILISEYLRKKVEQIDEAIFIKEQQINLLKERGQIILQNAVTQGLDPNVPMKNSGVNWIGSIPEHWEVRRSKFLFTQRKEKAWKDDVQLSATQAYGVIPQEQYEQLTGKSVVKIQFHLDKRKHVEKDDFVISMRSFQGGLERAWSRGCIRSSYVILKAAEKIEPAFYGYLLKLPAYIKALQQTASFIRDGQDLNFDNFSQVDLFIPPINEQIEIAHYIGKFTESANEAVVLLEQQIEKLREYKTSLIDSTVTGKIKITPEMVEG